MHVLTLLASREAAFLVILLLLGSGPASFLSERIDSASRIALAPVLGFGLGTCVTTTIAEFAPVDTTYWVLIPLALLSTSAAVTRTARSADRRRWRDRLRLRDLAALVLVGFAVTGPINATLRQRFSVGPTAYYFTDVDNYVANQDAVRSRSLQDALNAYNAHLHSGTGFGNLTQGTLSFFSQFGSNLDATTLDANVNALLGLDATDTFSPFLTVLLLMGALGAFAAVRHMSQSRTPAAALAGCLFGGAMFLELWWDSFQAAIIAIGMVVPFVALVDEALFTRRRAELVLVALVLGAMLTIYPLYIFLLLGTAAVMIGWRGLIARRRGRQLRPLLKPLALSILAVAGLAIVFDPVALARDVHYYHLILKNLVPYPRVGFTLPLDVLPGWLAQTREFWALSTPGAVTAIIPGFLLPVVFLGLIAIGLRRYPRALALVVLATACAAAAEYAYVSQQSCTYCAQRNLLPLGAIGAVLIALGLSALLASKSWISKLAGLVGLFLVGVPVALEVRTEQVRFSNGSYFLDTANREVLAKLPAGATLDVEGYGASVGAQAEQPLVYQLANERAPGRTSIVLGSVLNNAIQYLDFGGPRLPPGPEFNPRYRYVLTRLASVSTNRRVIVRHGSIALEERVKPLDITPYAGLSLSLARIDETGVAWVQTQYPLQFYIVGYRAGTAWARLSFQASVPVSIPRQTGVRTRVAGHTVIACVRATGGPPERGVNLTMHAALRPGNPPAEAFSPPTPLEGLALTSMRAVTGRCTL